MAASKKPARVKQVTANAARTIRKPKTTTTVVNSAERTAEVEAHKARRPGLPGNGPISREAMIKWQDGNPNKISNAARNLANAKPKAPKPPKAPK